MYSPVGAGRGLRRRRPAAAIVDLQLHRGAGGERPHRARARSTWRRRARSPTGATGTFSTALASLPAEMRKLAGARSFSFEGQRGAGCRRPASRRRRSAATAPRRSRRPPCRSRSAACRRPPGRPAACSDSVARPVIHVERSPAAERSAAPVTFDVPAVVPTSTLSTRPEAPRASLSAVTGVRSFSPFRIVVSGTGVGPQRIEGRQIAVRVVHGDEIGHRLSEDLDPAATVFPPEVEWKSASIGLPSQRSDFSLRRLDRGRRARRSRPATPP